MNEKEMLEEVRQGRLQITDEMINAQRMLHPELRNYSNQEIRRKIEERAAANPAEDTAAQEGIVPGATGKTGMPSGKAAQATRTEHRATNDSTAGRFPPDLKRFGYDFFQNNPNLGGIQGNTPALPDYVLSPGDEIQIYTWGRENQSQTVLIDNDGMFSYPPLQPMRIGGMKFAAAQQLMTREIEKINGLKASVSLGRLKSIRVMVLGEASAPGSYVVLAGATVTSVLFQCGGISDIGSLRAIQVRRGGRTLATLDLYDMLLRGSNRGDIQLLSGDAVFIPVADIQVAVTGKVKRPAIYEVKSGTKVLDVLELAGGLSSNAFKGRVRLDRVESHKRKVVLDISMEKVGGASNPAVLDGDILFVDQVLDKEFDVVYLKGNVNRPGRYEYRKGMTVKDLVPSAKDLKSETFFNYGHIKRVAEDDDRALLLPFSLSDVLEGKTDVPLQPRDTVIVYSRYDIMDQPVVKAEGMLRHPGTYPFVDQMRVSDLIIAAGGLNVEAYMPEAHILRLLNVQESDSLHATLIKVNMAGIVDNPGDENNLELKPFDSLIVFPRSNFILPKRVSVYGAVKREGEYELTENMGVRELISQAQGLTRNSYKLSVEVVRRQIVGDSSIKRQVYRIPMDKAMEGGKAFALQDGDGIYVREVANSRERTNVWVMGEFRFPGRYEFATGERLSSVIRRAGGFTRNAYLRGAVFIRIGVKRQQLEHVEEIARRLENQMQIAMERTVEEKERAAIQSAMQQRKQIIQDIRDAPYLGRVVIEMDKDLAFEGGEYDVALENGDSLWVGPTPNTVSILGEVYSPTNLVFTKSSNTIGECLDKAGGVNEYGDYKNTFYVSPDGTIKTPRTTPWLMSFRWKAIEPGGTIIVPPKGPKKDYLEVVAKMTQILYQIAISVGVAKTVF